MMQIKCIVLYFRFKQNPLVTFTCNQMQPIFSFRQQKIFSSEKYIRLQKEKNSSIQLQLPLKEQKGPKIQKDILNLNP